MSHTLRHVIFDTIGRDWSGAAHQVPTLTDEGLVHIFGGELLRRRLDLRLSAPLKQSCVDSWPLAAMAWSGIMPWPDDAGRPVYAASATARLSAPQLERLLRDHPDLIVAREAYGRKWYHVRPDADARLRDVVNAERQRRMRNLGIDRDWSCRFSREVAEAMDAARNARRMRRQVAEMAQWLSQGPLGCRSPSTVLSSETLTYYPDGRVDLAPWFDSWPRSCDRIGGVFGGGRGHDGQRGMR